MPFAARTVIQRSPGGAGMLRRVGIQRATMPHIRPGGPEKTFCAR